MSAQKMALLTIDIVRRATKHSRPPGRQIRAWEFYALHYESADVAYEAVVFAKGEIVSERVKTIMTVGDCVVVESLHPSVGPRRFFGEKNGETITKGFADPAGARAELEMMATRQAVQTNKWIVPGRYAAVGPNIFYLYPIGRLLLLALTLGRYPGEKHNRIFVAAFPGLLLASAFALVTVIYG